jgi:hypothetical protein
MKKNKTFDAVEMKNAIQAKRRRERASMSDEQVRQSLAGRLDTSDHPLSRKWRRLVPDRANQSSGANA